ncbi:50S ribosomal protein L9 [Magnetococcales bacterium HHB-1]
MEVILLEKISKLGNLGESVTVRAGYGRNYLIPQGKALPATEANRQKFEKQRQDFEQRQAEIKQQAEELAAKLDEVEIVLNRPAGVSEKLFGSVTNSDIAVFFREQELDIPRRLIEIPHAIRTLGEHKIILRLHPDVAPEMTVRVERSVR